MVAERAFHLINYLSLKSAMTLVKTPSLWKTNLGITQTWFEPQIFPFLGCHKTLGESDTWMPLTPCPASVDNLEPIICWRQSQIHSRSSVQFGSVAQSCPTLCNPMNCSTPGLPVHHQLPEFTQTHVHRVGDAIQLSHLCHPLCLLPPMPPSIRVFTNESTLCMRWPRYWSFSFSISPSKEHPGLISIRMDWLDLLAVHGTRKGLL